MARETLLTYYRKNYPVAVGHNKAARHYFNGHGYFMVGEAVTIDETYKGVTRGKIVGAFETGFATSRSGEVTYVIQVKLPKAHPDAQDENGEPQFTKYVLLGDLSLTKLNPEV